MGDIIWRADDFGHAVINDIPHIRVSAPKESVFMGFLIVPQFHYPVGYCIQRLVPGNGNKSRVFISTLSRVGSFHRCFDSVRVVDLLETQMRPRAAGLPVYLGIRVAADLDGPAVHDIRLFGTPRGAPLTGSRLPFAPYFIVTAAGVSESPQ